MSWECKKCGACCRSPFTEFWLPELWDNKEQKCINLNEDNLCSIYNNRPDKCNSKFIVNIPRSEEFQEIWCKFLDNHINKEKKNV